MKGDCDEKLVAAFQNGDEQAFERLFEKYRLSIYSICYRYLRNEADTQEVTLDIFKKIYHNLHKFHGKSKFFTWAYRISVNTCISFCRVHKEPRIVADASSLSQKVGERVHMKVAIDNALAELPERQRMCFILHFYEGYTFKEIGGIMHITSGAAKAHHHHAIMKLRKSLKGWS
jgi:RNA polymerase sigma-70 factor (ECF subfamily)